MKHERHLAARCAAVITFCVMIAPVVHAQETITPPFAGSYSLKNIGSPSGVPTPLGPLTFLNDNTLLVGGSADTSSGAIYSIGVTRDSSNHITGFNGTAVLFSTAPQIDGAMEFGPGGVLFFTGFPTNTMGEIKPGSSAPDKTVDLTAAGISSSVGGLEFAPNSDLKIVSYNSNGFYKAVLAADGSGTYNVSSTTLALTLTSASGPEGMIYVPVGSPVFVGPSMLLTDFGSGKISAYQVDSFDNPIDSSAQDFITGLTGALGATIDPLTNDFVFSTFGGGDHIDVVGGFAPTLPSVTLSPASLSFAGQLVGTTSSSKAVTLTNTGNGALSVASVAPSGDFAESNSCTGGPVLPGNHCMISVTATPSVAGSIPGEVTIADNAADSPQRVNLSGLGLTPLSAAPATLAFGTVAVGSSSAKTVTLTNNQPSTPLSLSFSTSGDFTAAGGGTTPCGSSLNGTKKCTMTVTFSPKYNGVINGALSVSYGSGTQDIALSGTGSTGGTAPLTFSPATLSFTNVLVGATSPGKTVTITNGGGTPVNISGIGPSGNYAATGSGARPCGGPLASAASCTISVTFSPTQAGTAAGAITIADDAAISPQDYKVTGTAVLPVTLVPASLTFPSQAVGTSSAALKVTLTNNQNVTLNISGIVPSGDYATTSIGTTPCGSSVPALGKCTFGVVFTPTSVGTIKGVVTVSTDANGSPQEVKMTGIAH